MAPMLKLPDTRTSCVNWMNWKWILIGLHTSRRLSKVIGRGWKLWREILNRAVQVDISTRHPIIHPTDIHTNTAPRTNIVTESAQLKPVWSKFLTTMAMIKGRRQRIILKNWIGKTEALQNIASLPTSRVLQRFHTTPHYRIKPVYDVVLGWMGPVGWTCIKKREKKTTAEYRDYGSWGKLKDQRSLAASKTEKASRLG